MRGKPRADNPAKAASAPGGGAVKTLTPAEGIAGVLRALATYVQENERLQLAEQANRTALVESMKALRLENIKLKVEQQAPADSPGAAPPTDEPEDAGKAKRGKNCNCRHHDRDPETLPWPGCPKHGDGIGKDAEE